MKCPRCGCENEEEAEFCKKCGRRFKSFLQILNDRINFASLFLGLVVSTSVLILSSLSLLIIGTMGADFSWILTLIFIIISFSGGIFAGLGCPDTMDGFVNGLFLGLGILMILGFFFGLTFLSMVFSVSVISTAFQGYPISTLPNEVMNSNLSSILIIINSIAFIFGILFSGALGGSLWIIHSPEFIKWGAHDEMR